MDRKAKTPAEASGAAKALVKGLALVDLISEHPSGLRLGDVTERAGLPKGTALRLLDTLQAHHLVRVDADGRYRLGPRCAAWGTAFLDGVELRSLARDLLERMVELSSETCHLGVEDGGRVLYLDKVDSPHSLRMVSRVGGTMPLHSSGLGKAMLPHLPAEFIDGVLAGGLERRTENTIVDPEALRRELARVRDQGYAVDDVENEEGVRCVAAPVFDHQGRVAAAISVAGPAHRMTRGRIDTLSPKLMAAARELSQRLGFTPPA
ncbi:MAG: helix-turn-helix domain-containing protein [Streptosporangiales bacterium]|nr:helix-turn-helix domain-containing protein [Streptosporangiales bacterium]